ncbi:MAG: glutathione S-transferase family protein [Myxococcota bacterium]|jgi:glutathione S-transferase|nr:glutathione S-transferase family protein [Myxococcota bacterium]
MSKLLLEKFPVPELRHWSAEGLDPGREVVLYHFGPSACSQKVRLALHEKSVAWTERLINLVAEENLAPDYMRINPRGVVPTLVDGPNTVFDSRTIMLYIDRNFPGPTLVPDGLEDRQVFDEWMARQDEFPIRTLTYGNAPGPMGRVMRGKVAKRVGLIERLQHENPDLADAYAVKRADTEGWLEAQSNAQTVKDVNAQIERQLEALETRLAEARWIAGDEYSLVDAAWTVMLGRLAFVGLGGLLASPSRPRVTDYYARVRGRPSFAAQVTRYQRKPYVLGQVIRGKFRAR